MKSGPIRDFQAAVRVLRSTLDFGGRSRRSDGAIYVFIVWLVGMLMAIIARIIPSMLELGFASQAPFWRDWPVWLVVFAPLIAWAVRRAHDAGGSGLYCLPLFGMIAARWLDLPDLVDSVLGGFIIIQIIILFIASPDAGPNRFGPNPRQDKRIEVLP